MATINGTSGNDTLTGTSGDDIINGLAGDDTISAGDGNDVIDSGDGNDVIDGGPGIDTVSYATATAAVWVNLAATAAGQNTLGSGYDWIKNVENLQGSAFNDFLQGNSGANLIDGGAGDDVIVGGGGGDMLTGGGGNDQFLYGVGEGDETITDLSAGDRIVLDGGGYTTWQSITQVGNDVVIAFSATDQLTCLNTDVATVEAALPHPSTFTQPPSTIIPLLPTRPDSTTASGTVITGTVASDQIYYAVEIDPTFGPYGTYFRAGWGSPLVTGSSSLGGPVTNNGTIWDASARYSVNTVWADSLVNGGTIVAEVGPFMPPGMATMQYWFARAVALGSASGIGTEIFQNTGSIFSIASSGDAIGVYTEDAQKSTFVNSGLIAVQATYGADHSQSGGGQGFRMTNGGNFINEAGGQILVEGDGLAYGVYEGRGSHPAWDLGPEILNRGLIHVVVGSEAARPSVGIYAVNLPTELMRIDNSGTIRADIAIYCPSDPTDAFTSSTIINPQTVTNEAGGIIDGNIQLERGNDTLINAGTITGTVDMGGEDDLVDNSAGVINGVVLLGDGNDTFTGGASADHARGGIGDDTLTGRAGADLLEGDFGNDTLDGGAGNDGLYGGNGDDVLRTSGGDIAHGNYGNDRIETGDYTFAQIDGGPGYDQWVLPTGARTLDLGSVAASGRVTSIEEIDLGASQSLLVHAADVTPITGRDTLHLRGDSTDSVYLDGNWSSISSISENGVTYARYQSGTSFVLVESGVSVTIGTSPPATGGLDPIAGGAPAPAPDADAEANVLSISGFELQSDLLISADDVWRSPDGAPVLLFDYIAAGGQLPTPPNIVNYGQIVNDVGLGAVANAVGGITGTFEFGTFSNHGSILAETQGAATDAIAFFGGSSGTLTNDGDIAAIAHGRGDATAVSTYDNQVGAAAATNQSSGVIDAFSQSGFATGVYSSQGGAVVNDGLIQVQGFTGAVGVDQFNSGGGLINSGQIHASISPKGTGISIGLAHDSVLGGGLTNSGLIAADIAVLFQTRYGETFTIDNSGTIDGAIVWNIPPDGDSFGRLDLSNTGRIAGNIVADPTSTGTETIVNSGTIAGDLQLYGGNDFYDGTSGTLVGTIYAGAGNDSISGGSNGDTFYGGDGNDTLIGNGGNDILDGGAGNDTLDGGSGMDTASYVDALSGVEVSLAMAGPQDTVGAGTDTLTNIEGLIGSAFADKLIGTANGNLLDGGAGADLLEGGAGNDRYIVDNVGDRVVENPGEGTDLVQSSVTFKIGANVENLTLTGGNAIDGTGNELANVITGNSAANILDGSAGDDTLIGNGGDDTLNGGSGADSMAGGSGNDTYFVDNALDTVTENPGAGTDLVKSSISYALGANVENLTLFGPGVINGTGNALDNVIIGNAQANTLIGLDGNDVLNGGAGADTLQGGLGDDTYIVDNVGDRVIEGVGRGNDTVLASVSFKLASNVENLTLTGSSNIDGTGNELDNFITGNNAVNSLDGSSGNDTLIGNGGDDTLNGGTGNDTMIGGAGNDTYFVDSAGDVVTENPGEGVDIVKSTVSWTLGANTENLTLVGSGVINGTGNELNNVIIGNAQANIIDGGLGADTMQGAAGDDTYIVDNVGDRVIEGLNQGNDTALSSVTFKLGSNVENLTLTGGSAIDATGNELANVITGNNAANVLDGSSGNDTLIGNGGDDVLNGGSGADSMAGGSGNDTYFVDNVGDVVTENPGAGTDLVKSTVSYTLGANVENLILFGPGVINGTGNALDNVIIGNAQANTLIGGAGTDHMTGGAGNDMFLFMNGDFGGATIATADEITDFTSGQDKIDLTGVDANTLLSGDQAFGFIGTAPFSDSAGELRYEQISGNTYIEGDINGDGIADFMIKLDGLHALVGTDFGL